MPEYSKLIDRMKSSRTFLIVSHVNPDGDAIGSSLALKIALEKIGKEVTVFNRDGVPLNLKFLPGSSSVTRALNPAIEFDMTLMLDVAQKDRVSKEFETHQGLGEIVCIDHHILPGVEASHALIDDGAASTGEVVKRLLERAGWEIDADIATCIYTTLVVDTGFFRFSSTDQHVFSVAAELVGRGASPWYISKHLEESFPLSRYKLLAMCLDSIEVHLDGTYATMDVTQKMLKKSGANVEESEEFANYPRAIAGVEVSALFRETEDGKVKVSLRSKDRIDVARIAKAFDGGGHVKAAGFRMRGSIKDVKKSVLEAVVALEATT